MRGCGQSVCAAVRPAGHRMKQHYRMAFAQWLGLKQNVSWRASNLQIVRSIACDGRFDAISTARADVSTETGNAPPGMVALPKRHSHRTPTAFSGEIQKIIILSICGSGYEI